MNKSFLSILSAILAILTIGCSSGENAAVEALAEPWSAADSASGIHWGSVQGGLRAGIKDRGAGNVSLVLENKSGDSIQVLSHVAAHENHYDWFRLQVKSAANGSQGEFLLLDSRNRSAWVDVKLAPEGQLNHEVDLNAWIFRRINGGKGLVGGRHELWFTYEVRDKGYWNGKLESGKIFVDSDKNGRIGQ